VRRRANFACEFCGVSETDAGGQLTVDHFQPRHKGGDDSLENLIYRARKNPMTSKGGISGRLKTLSGLFRSVLMAGSVALWLPSALNVSAGGGALRAALPTAPDARQIVEGVYRQDASRDATWRATMEVMDKKGTVRRKKFALRRLGSFGQSKTLVRFTDPPEVRGVGLLSYNQAGGGDRQWMYTPAIQRVRRIAPQERSRRFLGTDFTHEDMAERVLDDFTYKLLGEGEVIDGRKTYQIEARPVAADRSQYKYLHLWVAQDIPYTLLVEMYDRDGQKVRRMQATQIEKVSGIWVAKRFEMSSLLENTKTTLIFEEIRFNTGLKEDLFTQQALEKADLF
jgi:outer membrane lipoprotein-sorting protein